MLHRMPAALLWPTLIQLLLLAVNAHAAKFDERVRPPPEISTSELHGKLKKQLDRMKEPGEMTKLLRNKAAYHRWNDLRWQLGESIDRRRAMPQLAELGMVGRENGSYHVDHKEHPEWWPMDERLVMTLSPTLDDFDRQQLRNRGFRESDFVDLDAYLSTHSLKQAMAKEHDELVFDFSERFQRSTARGETISRVDVRSFAFQRDRCQREAMRLWAVDLLDSLDSQRQRILESYLMEQRGGWSISPTDIEQDIDEYIEVFRTGEYVRQIRDQEHLNQ